MRTDAEEHARPRLALAATMVIGEKMPLAMAEPPDEDDEREQGESRPDEGQHVEKQLANVAQGDLPTGAFEYVLHIIPTRILLAGVSERNCMKLQYSRGRNYRYLPCKSP